MIINGFLFFWLVVFAAIGVLCVVVGGVGLFALFYIWLRLEQEQRQREQEYEGMKHSLLRGFK